MLETSFNVRPIETKPLTIVYNSYKLIVMKTSKEYYDEALEELGASKDRGIPITAGTELALIKAMKDFLEELEGLAPFQFDDSGNLRVTERP